MVTSGRDTDASSHRGGFDAYSNVLECVNIDKEHENIYYRDD